MAMIACAVLPFIHLTLQSPGINNLATCILLPFIAALTSAACSGVVCRFSHVSPELQVPAIIVAYLQVGAGLTLATVLDAILVVQYLNCSQPLPETVYQDMILCSPFGQSSFALQALGQAVNSASVATYDREKFLTHAAGATGFISLFFGLLVWGYGVFWWCFASMRIVHTLCAQPGGWRQTRFSMAAWSLIFPWGAFTNAAVVFGRFMQIPAFGVFSMGLLVLLVLMWIVSHGFMVWGLVTGRILGLECGWRVSYRGSEKIKEV
ncbi:hypothetical protein N7508_009084 [Penicillium antarcticum]|uniref:uncharacterized protein n=1 Tax=Penicillium antarcticum TaxID=416450 RepID=UPI0023858DB0|nr:uncharacterized protein N7508_009084 [Penicillium antarcticum]KAJ5294263.1 hypothetical protein N7508_009084 [Penicillium antarcticum]